MGEEEEEEKKRRRSLKAEDSKKPEVETTEDGLSLRVGPRKEKEGTDA